MALLMSGCEGELELSKQPDQDEEYVCLPLHESTRQDEEELVFLPSHEGYKQEKEMDEEQEVLCEGSCCCFF